MLEGGGSGFFNLVVLLLVLLLLLGQLITFVLVRRKWRLAVAREEEIKRLLAMTAEETARVELEAAASYENGNLYKYAYNYLSASEPESDLRQSLYECVVCFSPTNTRCSRCKAVRYCSGRCQIIHWRQGHKDECRPFSTTCKINDVVSCSGQKTFKKEKYNAEQGRFQNEAKELDETLPAEPPSPKSTFYEVLGKKDEFEVMSSMKKKGTSETSKLTNYSSCSSYVSSTSSESSVAALINNEFHSDLLDEWQSAEAEVVPHQSETNYSNLEKIGPKLVSSQPEIDKSFDDLTDSDSCYQTKPSSIDVNTSYVSQRSSPSSVDNTSGSSFFEPHTTPSLDFWKGTTVSHRLRTDTPNNSASAPPNLSEASDSNVANVHSNSSLSMDKHRNSHVYVERSGTKIDIRVNNYPSVDKNEKQCNVSVELEDVQKGAQKHKKSQSSASEAPHMHMDSQACSYQPASVDVEHSSFGGYAAPASSGRRCSAIKNGLKASSSSSLNYDDLHRIVNNRATVSSTPKPEKVSLASNASEAHLSSRLQSSGTQKHSFHNEKSMKVDRVDGLVACSPQLGGFSQNSKNGLKSSVWKVVDHLRGSKSSIQHLAEAGSDIVGRYNNKGLFSYELFVKLYNWNQVDLRPCGLINCGNSCYANAVLQCLAFTPPLTAYLLQGLHSKACRRKQRCFTCEFESLVLKAKEGNSTLSPIGILSQVQAIGSHLTNGIEQDAHEFLRCAIDTMQTVCLKEAGGDPPSVIKEETTLIGLTFGGYLRSKIKCMRCGGKSERHERMTDLTVEIEGDIETLEDALHRFTSTETLDGENKYECSRCKSYEKAKKKLTVLEAPNILTIALKRFQSGKFGKLNKLIQFPEILDMTPFISGTSDKCPIYRLYGVVVHLDIMNAAFSGHYVCYVKNFQNKWYKIDDSMVKSVELESVLKKRAYILLYARCSPRSPRLIRNTIIPCDSREPNSTSVKSRFPPISPNNAPLPESYRGNIASFQSIQTIQEEDAFSDNSSSLFSEVSSSTTDSSNRDSSGMEDYVDQIFGDFSNNWRSPWRNSSDSDTSSSSSSLSPIYSGYSPLTKLDPYVSSQPENNCPRVVDNAESSKDAHGFWAKPFNKSSKAEHADGKGSVSTWCSDSPKQHRKLASSCSCRESSSDRLGWANPFNHLKNNVPFRRSTRERRD